MVHRFVTHSQQNSKYSVASIPRRCSWLPPIPVAIEDGEKPEQSQMGIATGMVFEQPSLIGGNDVDSSCISSLLPALPAGRSTKPRQCRPEEAHVGEVGGRRAPCTTKSVPCHRWSLPKAPSSSCRLTSFYCCLLLSCFLWYLSSTTSI